MLVFLKENESDRLCTDAWRLPRLLFMCKIGGEECGIPRVMHKHDERLEIMFMARGSGDYSIDGVHYLVKEGDILIFNAGITHEERPHVSEDSLIYCCGLDGLHIDGLKLNQLEERKQPGALPSGDRYSELLCIFELLWLQASRKEQSTLAIINSAVEALLVSCKKVWQESAADTANENKVLGKRIKTFIDAHYNQELTLQSIARDLNINRFYLIHSFKAYSGYSPKQYLIRRRIGEAQSLLLSSDDSIAQIATQVGFENVTNFHRVFKQIVGIPPIKYKKLWLREEG